MCSPKERDAALSARCSPYAAEYLSQFRIHPLYSEMLSRLDARSGRIYAHDIEQLFLSLSKNTAQARYPGQSPE